MLLMSALYIVNHWISARNQRCFVGVAHPHAVAPASIPAMQRLLATKSALLHLTCMLAASEGGQLPDLGLHAYKQPFGRIEIALRLSTVQLQLLQRALGLAACPLADKRVASDRARTNNCWRLVVVSTDAAAVTAAQAEYISSQTKKNTRTGKHKSKKITHFYDYLIAEQPNEEDADLLCAQPRVQTVNIVNADKIDNDAIGRMIQSSQVSPLPLPVQHWKTLTSPHTHVVTLFEQSVAGALLLLHSTQHNLVGISNSRSRHDLFHVLGVPLSSEMHRYRTGNDADIIKGPPSQNSKVTQHQSTQNNNFDISMSLFARDANERDPSHTVMRKRENDLLHRWQWLVDQADAFIGSVLGREVRSQDTAGWAAMWLQETVCHLSILVNNPSLFSLRPPSAVTRHQIQYYRQQRHLAATKLLALALRHRLREFSTGSSRRYRPIADLIQRLVETMYQVSRPLEGLCALGYVY